MVRPGSVVTTPRRAVSLWAQHCAHVYFSLRQLGKSFSRASNSNSLIVFPSFAAKILSWRCSSSVTGKFTCFRCIQPPCVALLATQQRKVKEKFSRKLRMRVAVMRRLLYPDRTFPLNFTEIQQSIFRSGHTLNKELSKPCCLRNQSTSLLIQIILLS